MNLRNIFRKKEIKRWFPVLEGDFAVTPDSEENTWEPVPGFEKYMVQNTVTGKVKTLGKQFDFHIGQGLNEESSAYFTMMWLKGYLAKDKLLTENIEHIIKTMERSWKMRSISCPEGKITISTIEQQWKAKNVYERVILFEKIKYNG